MIVTLRYQGHIFYADDVVIRQEGKEMLIETIRDRRNGKRRTPYVVKFFGKYRRVYNRINGGFRENYITIDGRYFVVTLREDSKSTLDQSKEGATK